MAAVNKPTPQAIREQLKRILGSAEFKATDKQRKFLSFVVGETLEDRASRLKGYTIAVDVYGRRENFDPQVDPNFRHRAHRMIGRYVKVEDLIDKIIVGLQKAGLGDLE